MKTLFCFRIAVIISSVAAVSATANASYDHLSGTLVDQIKPNMLITKPKLSNSLSHPYPYIKLASVRFITDRVRMVDFSCPNGWVYQNGWCRIAACEGYPYTNVAQTANCATVDTCLSGDVMKYKCRSCKPNLVSDGSGGCYCDSSVYKYDVMSNPCFYKYDERTACTYVDASGASSTAYGDCLCSPEWTQCESSRHHVGSGDVCISRGKRFYAQCQCAEAYSSPCISLGGRPVNESDYCLLNGIYYYKSCYYCDNSKGEYYTLDNFWCDGIGWREITPIPSRFY